MVRLYGIAIWERLPATGQHLRHAASQRERDGPRAVPRSQFAKSGHGRAERMAQRCLRNIPAIVGETSTNRC